MPLNPEPAYRAPFPLMGGHLQTVYASEVRRVRGVEYKRERIDTADGDFLDLDWSAAREGDDDVLGGVAIVTHGLEGHSRRTYVLGMVRALNRAGWEVVAWNLRGCSGEMNRLVRFYHSGASDDLGRVVEHVADRRPGQPLALVGFSLGGNITLKYLGERGDDAPEAVRCAAVFSVPCDLKASALRMAEPGNGVYMARFMHHLKAKVRAKARLFPGELDLEGLDRMRDFRAFDDRFTGPLNGFGGAEEYWRRCSSKPLVPAIRRPTLVVAARNDPFLTPECHPEAAASEWVYLELPRHGGHAGFPQWGGTYWSEERTVDFAAQWA